MKQTLKVRGGKNKKAKVRGGTGTGKKRETRFKNAKLLLVKK
jgi:hypothetical protein